MSSDEDGDGYIGDGDEERSRSRSRTRRSTLRPKRQRQRGYARDDADDNGDGGATHSRRNPPRSRRKVGQTDSVPVVVVNPPDEDEPSEQVEEDEFQVDVDGEDDDQDDEDEYDDGGALASSSSESPVHSRRRSSRRAKLRSDAAVEQVSADPNGSLEILEENLASDGDIIFVVSYQGKTQTNKVRKDEWPTIKANLLSGGTRNRARKSKSAAILEFKSMIDLSDEEERWKKRRKSKKKKKKHPQLYESSSSETVSSSSDSEEHFQKKVSRKLQQRRNQITPINQQPSSGSSMKADVDPMDIDTSVTFASVGGLSQHIHSLKEMVLLPLLYPEVFTKFSIKPPRGVLFHGPPGTGKTLVARALANTCSTEERNVSFYMRKGADCLSKWVGEAERQLRLLFDEAYKNRPSIIFFDEIDGLAPVRSAKQDQIHSSIVSTLLALMDGVDDRGQVVVIGATNRIDSVDPALRRPGRFEREMLFSLPSVESRLEIFEIHTKNWEPSLSDQLKQSIAAKTIGYCGADIKALCTEAALCSLRSVFPQIYDSTQRLVLDLDQVVVEERHLVEAMSRIVPASRRSGSSSSEPLERSLVPLLGDAVAALKDYICSSFPVFVTARQSVPKVQRDPLNRPVLVTENYLQPPAFHSRLLICGDKGMGQSDITLAALTVLQTVVFNLDMSLLFSDPNTSTLEGCVSKLLLEAHKSSPAIIFIPNLSSWWNHMPNSVKSILLSTISQTSSLLLIAWVSSPPEELTEDILELFPQSTHYQLTTPSEHHRRKFFLEDVFQPISLPTVFSTRRVLPTLDIAAPIPPAAPPYVEHHVNSKSKRKEKRAKKAKRELGLIFEGVLQKVYSIQRFLPFRHPVDLRAYPDYEDCIENPCDLATMSQKNFDGYYTNRDEFIADFELILKNAKRYNAFDDESRAPYLAKEMLDRVLVLLDVKRTRHACKRAEKYISNSVLMDQTEDICGICRKTGILLICEGDCLRSFHLACVELEVEPPEEDTWLCFECMAARKPFFDDLEADKGKQEEGDPVDDEDGGDVLAHDAPIDIVFDCVQPQIDDSTLDSLLARTVSATANSSVDQILGLRSTIRRISHHHVREQDKSQMLLQLTQTINSL